MTVPDGDKPPTGWPVIVFNHGYIQPEQYRTTKRYVAYQGALAQAGYITFNQVIVGTAIQKGRRAGIVRRATRLTC